MAMPIIDHVVTENAPFQVSQEETVEVVRDIFGMHFRDIERLLQVFENGMIKNRYLAAPLDWFTKERGLEEKNELYIDQAIQMGSRAVEKCIQETGIQKDEIDALFFISSSGMAAPTIDARIINELSLPLHVKRVPIWGLGCAGGAAGIGRAHDYLLAYPDAKVLVLCLELCSLTFQRDDFSKSNLIGTSLFADGAACVLMSGENNKNQGVRPRTIDTQSTLMPHSEGVMGWNVKDGGLHVIFSRDIPSIIEKWLQPNVQQFLNRLGKKEEDIDHFVAHPGGKKVLHAYEKAFGFPSEKTQPSQDILVSYGNMSSPTVLYVLKEIMNDSPKIGEEGILTALGPGFSSEIVWLEWGE